MIVVVCDDDCMIFCEVCYLVCLDIGIVEVVMDEQDWCVWCIVVDGIIYLDIIDWGCV